MTRAVLLISTSTIFIACLLALFMVVATKTRRTARSRKRTALLRPFRSQLIAVSAGEDPDGQALSVLVAAEGTVGRLVDQAAVDMLGKIRGLPADQLVQVLRVHGAVRDALPQLEHHSPVRRAQAAQLLGLSSEASAVPALVVALSDDAVEVRTSAAYALGLVGDPAAAGPLLAAVDAPGAGLPAGVAAQALLGMGVGISDALLEALGSDRPGTRHLAAYLSGAGSFRRSVPALRGLLERDDDLTVRQASATALGVIGSPVDVAVLALHTAADHALTLRRICAAALGELGDPSAVPTLTRLLDDPDPRLAELAASALVKLGPTGQTVLRQRPPDRPDTPRREPVEAALTVARLQGVMS